MIRLCISRRALTAATASVLMFGFIVGSMAYAIFLYLPPAPLPETAPDTEFSAIRAKACLRKIATAPHPMGSQMNAAVRRYIVDTLASMGVSCEANLEYDDEDVRTPNNIVARIPGTSNTKAFLLSAHYDSVPHTVGACDDGAGVATLLETCRALRAGEPLRNDVMFLFTDGEERGLLGAKAFLKESSCVKNVGLMLNFDSSTVEGPACLITSKDNGWLIREILKAVPCPIMSSLLVNIYWLPKFGGHTDFQKMNEAIHGMESECFSPRQYFHTQQDTVEHVSPRSMQQYGIYASCLTRHFGSIDLDCPKTQPAETHFNFLRPFLVHYPARYDASIVLVALALFFLVFALGLSTHRLSLDGVVKGFLVFLGCIVLEDIVLDRLMTLRNTAGIFNFRVDEPFMVVLAALAILVAMPIFNWASKKLSVENFFMGALVCWLIGAFLILMIIPGGGYLFEWPLLFSLLALGTTFLLSKDKPFSPIRLIVLAIGALPGLVLLAPAIYMILSMAPSSTTADAMIFDTLLMGLLIPHFSIMNSLNKWWIPLISTTAALAFVLPAVFVR